MRLTLIVRALASLGLAAAGLFVLADPATAADEATVCFDASLARARTEIDADLVVQQFDGSLGSLLEITVTGPSIHLDTDAVFENTASSAVVFAEHMDYQVLITSPSGLASPPPIAGTIQRVPSQTLTAFDGTLDFLGTSAVVQPSTARDETAGTASSTDPSTLSAFTGTGTMPFHLATAISETFTGGGGNVEAQINTFAAAAVRVCYRYALPPPEVAGEVTTPSTPPPPATPTVTHRTLPLTGRSSVPLTVAGMSALVVGVALARRFRSPRPSLDA